MTLVQAGRDSRSFLRHLDGWEVVGGRRWLSKGEIVVGAVGIAGNLSLQGFGWSVRLGA